MINVISGLEVTTEYLPYMIAGSEGKLTPCFRADTSLLGELRMYSSIEVSTNHASCYRSPGQTSQ